jgi:uncharacterized protein (DUF1330 family)
MAAYIIADIRVHDASKFEGYRARVPATLTPYGGRFIVRGGKVETIEGTWAPSRLVILEFPSMERAKAWWNSEEYAEPKELRQAASEGQFLLVEGFD